MVLERWRPRWGLTTWRPFRELEDWQRQMEDFFGRPIWKPDGGEKAWMPAVDIFEKDDKFIVKAELPGMKEEDIDVSVVGDTLNIKGERKTESEVKDEDYYRCERSYGSFHRSIGLPSDVDPSKIEANYEDGVLEVSLPKLAEVKPKKVTVSARKRATKAA
ncbi:MAG: Hsp20/alpha crystallin family protein [Dehalococcoidales bacterium]|nr:Hsp20/alpha crystallin family protein [Dehalococcoidales bacterium]